MLYRALLALGVLGIAAAVVPASAHDTVYYFMTDTLHSTVVVTDQNRNIVEETHYAPYGRVLNRSMRDGPGYAGHEEDPATGLVYMQQRYYDPRAGRFLSVDPVGVDTASGGNFNRYWYAKDNPYRYTDPDGRCAGGMCDQMVQSVGEAISDSGSTTLSPVARVGLSVMLGVSGLGDVVEAVSLVRTLHAVSSASKTDFVVSRNGTVVHSSPAKIRASLEGAGFKGKAIANKSGTETGTVHNVPHMKMDIRVMDGGGNHSARVVTNQPGTRSMVDSATGKPFKNIVPKSERINRSHIKLKDLP